MAERCGCEAAVVCSRLPSLLSNLLSGRGGCVQRGVGLVGWTFPNLILFAVD